MKIRQVTLFTLIALMVCALVACATFMGPRDVEIPLSAMQQAAAKRFPFHRRYLELFDVTVSNPRLAMQTEANRIQASMDTAIVPPLLQRTWNGNLTISGSLRFDAARGTLMLVEPRVESLKVDGLDARYASMLGQIGALLSDQVLQDMPLYTMRPDDLRYAGTSYTPSKITTTSEGIVVTFEPVK